MSSKTVINENFPFKFSDVIQYEEKFNLKPEHDRLLKILVTFDEFCRKNKIRYSLADGTLLGAMRHADFIPWDDDADVMITRDEYNKLKTALTPNCGIKLFKACFLDRITIDELANDKVYIDLFINEDMPADRMVFKWKKFKTRFLRTYFSQAEYLNTRHAKDSDKKKTLQSFLGKIGRNSVKFLIGKRDIFEINDRAVNIKNHKPSGIYTRFTSRMYETNRRFNKQSYDEGYADILFRGNILMSVKNADTFLKEMYGDYLSMPPEEKRVPEHAVNMLDCPHECIKWIN